MTPLNKHLVSAYAGYFFRYVYLIVLIPFYARTLGPSAYGLVLAAMSVQTIVWTIQNWGFAFAGARNIASMKTPAQHNEEFTRHLNARYVLLPIAVAVGIASILASPLLRANPATAGLALLCGVIAGFNLGWYFQGKLNFTTPVIIEIIGFVITLSIVLLLVRTGDDAIYVMVALTASSVITSFIAYFVAFKSVRLVRVKLERSFNLIKESTPLFISGGTYALMTSIGTYSLASLSTADQVAYFGTAEKIVTTALGLLTPATQVLFAWFSKLLHESPDTKEVFRQQKQAVKWVCLAGALATVVSLTIAPPVMSLILGKKFDDASAILRALSPLFLLAAINRAVSTYIFLPRRLDRQVSIINVASTAVGIGLTVLGAWRGGALGAAFGRVGAEFINFLLLMGFYYYQEGKPGVSK